MYVFIARSVALFSLLLGTVSVEAQRGTSIFRSDLANAEFAFTGISGSADGGYFTIASGVDTRQLAVTKFDNKGTPVWSVSPEDARSSGLIVATADGGALVLGNNESFQRYFDASVLQLSPDGEFVRETIWGNPDVIDGWNDAKRLALGEVLAAGFVTADDEFTEYLLMVKLDANGEVLWEKVYEGDAGGRFGSIMEGADGSFYLVGGTSEGTTVLAHFAADGTPIRAEEYAFSTRAELYRAIRLADGSIIFVGSENSTPTTPNVLLFKVDPQGNPLWTKRLRGDLTMNVIDMHLRPDNRILITAASSNQFLPVVDNDNVVMEIDTAGKLLDYVSFGSDTRDFLLSSTVLSDGAIALVGFANENGGLDSTRAFTSIVPYPGTPSCEKTYKITEMDGIEFNSMTEILFDELPIATSTDYPSEVSSFPFSETTVNCLSTRTSEQVSACPALEALPRNAQLFEVLPPLYNVSNQVSLEVIDATGRRLFARVNPTADWVRTETANLPAGIYFYTLRFAACERQQLLSGRMSVFK